MNGKMRFQSFFQKMQIYALEGQNYYNAVDVTRTGEINVISLIEKKFILGNKFIFFDVGANKGQYTDMFLSKISSDALEVHLFEPQKAMYDILNKKYSGRNNFFVNHVAVGDSATKDQTLYVCSKQNLIASVTKFPLEDYLPKAFLDETEGVDIIQLDEYCKKNKIDEIGLLKLDVEGFEYQCMAALIEKIRSGEIRFIQFEYCFINMVNKNYFYDFWKLLNPRYQIFRILKDGLYKIDEYNIILEQMAPINYLAVLKG